MLSQSSVHQTTVIAVVTWRRFLRLVKIWTKTSSNLTQHLGKLSQTQLARPQTTFCNCGGDRFNSLVFMLLSAVLGFVDLLSLSLETGPASSICMSPNSFVWRFCCCFPLLYKMLKVKCHWIFFPCCTLYYLDSEGVGVRIVRYYASFG
jgi:hypothetical protein